MDKCYHMNILYNSSIFPGLQHSTTTIYEYMNNMTHRLHAIAHAGRGAGIVVMLSGVLTVSLVIHRSHP